MLFGSEHFSGHRSVAEGNGHHMAEIIIRCSKLQFSSGINDFRLYIEHRTQLTIAMGVQLNLPTVLSADDGPSLLDMTLEPMLRSQQ